MWDVGSGTWRENHINFCNRYLLLLKEHTGEEAECTLTGEVLWGLEKGRNSKAGRA